MATNMFIKFDGVNGEASAATTKMTNPIEILSWSHGFSQPSSPLRTATGSTVEKANHSNLSFTKFMDVATRDLLKACWNGTQFKTVDIECYRASGEDDAAAIMYLLINMTEVVISNYSLSGGGGNIPIENLSLAYGKITYTYDSKKKEETGAADTAKKAISHDLKTNKVS